MSQDQFDAVDRYIADSLALSDPILDQAQQASDSAGLPAISVTPNQGKLLQLLARSVEARTILELGTLAGYSTIWLARALPPDGRLVTLEADARHAEVARGNIEQAGLTDIVQLRLGPALETLPQLAKEGLAPFDLIFIDADKVNTAAYFDWAVRLAHPGSLIIVDNVVRKGAVVDPGSSDPNVQGVRRFYQQLADDSRVSATAIQTVGSKGYDGLAIALVTGE